MRSSGGPVVRCGDGMVRGYAEFEDVVKPCWKELMYREFYEEGL